MEQSVEQLPRVLERDRGDVLLLLDGYNNLLSECTPDRSRSAACSGKIADVVSGLRECVRIARRPAYGVRYVLVSTLTPPGPYAGGPRDRRIAADAIVRPTPGWRTWCGVKAPSWWMPTRALQDAKRSTSIRTACTCGRPVTKPWPAPFLTSSANA